jgi:hypothetical protein
MEYATVYSHTTNMLSWKSDNNLTVTKTTNDTTRVTNSLTATIYWRQGAVWYGIASTAYIDCVQDTGDLTWEFSESNSGSNVRITLTVSGTGSSGPLK